MATADGQFVEGHELPKALALKVPKTAIDRALNAKEAEVLLTRLAARG
jgi:hypothetical protein